MNLGIPYWPQPRIPAYQKSFYKRWACLPTPKLSRLTYGYFFPHPSQPKGWMFKRDDVVWMSLTAMETESQTPMIHAAHGHTVIAGLGMGFVLYNIAAKPEVTKVTVLELDPDVVALMDRVTSWRHWPGSEKITLVMGDAADYVATEPVDFLYADTWAHLGAEEAIPVTQRIQAGVKAKAVAWWGQELDFVAYCGERHLPHELVNARAYQEFVAHTGLPLIEQNNIFYPRLALLAATMQTAGSCEDAFGKNVLQNHAANLLLELAQPRC
jgi:hypothetical protein